MHCFRGTLLLALILCGCAARTQNADAFGQQSAPGEFPLAPLGSFAQDAPPAEEIESEVGKADVRLPARLDLLANESPVRNQDRKGLCAAFALTSVIEHVYRARGIDASPDFSEQFVAWLGHGRRYRSHVMDAVDEGFTLDVIRNLGIPDEAAWPYIGSNWSSEDDVQCVPDEVGNMPGFCRSNGAPPESAFAGTMHRIGGWHYLRHDVAEFKTYMAVHNEPVLSGLSVVWPIFMPNADAHGYISLPSVASRAMPAGDHAISIVGWDDELQIPRNNGSGDFEVDRNGHPIYDRGVFIFRNSWGSGWASENPARAGYGYVSYRYFRKFGSLGISVEPPRESPAYESCTNDIDDDEDGDADCADSECMHFPRCLSPDVLIASTAENSPIPAHSTFGAWTFLHTEEPNFDTVTTNVEVTIRLRHSDGSRLNVVLFDSHERAVTLLDGAPAQRGEFTLTFSTHDYDGGDPEGRWRLEVRAPNSAREGTLVQTTLRVTRGPR